MCLGISLPIALTQKISLALSMSLTLIDMVWIQINDTRNRNTVPNSDKVWNYLMSRVIQIWPTAVRIIDNKTDPLDHGYRIYICICIECKKNKVQRRKGR